LGNRRGKKGTEKVSLGLGRWRTQPAARGVTTRKGGKNREERGKTRGTVKVKFKGSRRGDKRRRREPGVEYENTQRKGVTVQRRARRGTPSAFPRLKAKRRRIKGHPGEESDLVSGAHNEEEGGPLASLRHLAEHVSPTRVKKKNRGLLRGKEGKKWELFTRVIKNQRDQ